MSKIKISCGNRANQHRPLGLSPDVPGCAAVGETEDVTRLSFENALTAHFELMPEIGEPVPRPCRPTLLSTALRPEAYVVSRRATPVDGSKTDQTAPSPARYC